LRQPHSKDHESQLSHTSLLRYAPLNALLESRIVEVPLVFLHHPVQQAADRLGYNFKHLYRLLNSGKVNGQRVGHIWLIDRQEVECIRAFQGEGGRLPKSVPEQ
jgi:excisionase family DNA binding protein